MPDDLWRPDVVLWAGPRTHFVHYPLRRGELYNLVAVFHSDHYEEGWNAEGAKPTSCGSTSRGQRAGGACACSSASRPGACGCCATASRSRTGRKGRVTLLGDAAHPMLQYLAQGACMATEDAVTLAEKVAAQPDDLPAAFHAYVQERYLRTARVQIMARVYGDFYHARGPARTARHGGRARRRCYDGIAWLYGGP